MKTLPRSLPGAALAACLVALPAQGEEYAVSAGAEYFSWREYQGDTKLLEETGPRYFVAFAVGPGEDAAIPYDIEARIYGGNVHYDGQTWGGAPVTTDVEYRGASSEIGLSKFNNTGNGTRVGIRVALGFDGWERNITGAGGYKENYNVVFGRLGFPIQSESRWNAELGMKYPLWARETAGLKGAQVSVLVNGVWVDGTIGEDPEFEPEGQLSFYAHMDLWRSKNWDLRLRYDSFRFDASDLVEAPFLLADGTRGSLLVRQPDSHADTYGLEFRRRF